MPIKSFLSSNYNRFNIIYIFASTFNQSRLCPCNAYLKKPSGNLSINCYLTFTIAKSHYFLVLVWNNLLFLEEFSCSLNLKRKSENSVFYFSIFPCKIFISFLKKWPYCSFLFLGEPIYFFSYSCVHCSSDEVIFKIMKKPSILQK